VVRLLLALVLTAGCSQCRSGTVLLEMDLLPGTDGLDITLQLNAEPSRGYQRSPTGTHEYLEVSFARDYPTGSNLSVYVNALSGGNSIGERSQDVRLAEGCTSLLLDFTP
jgi:hypothetical protein